MKRKIILRLILIGVLSISLTTLFTTLIYYNFFQKQVRSDLKIIGRLLAESYPLLNDSHNLDFKPVDFRLTLISSNGEVIYESDADLKEMENHRNRPEIVKAFQTGEGEDIRQSSTLGKNTYYYACLLPDDNVLRVARETNNIWKVFAGVLPAVFTIALLMFLLCLILSRLLTKTIIKPIEEMAENMESLEENLAYEELAPFARTISKQNSLIRQQLEYLEQENTRIQSIMENMSEGIVVLNKDKSILTVNTAAIKLFSAGKQDYSGKNLLYLTRDELLNEYVERALAGKSQSLEMQLNGRVVDIYVNPVRRKGYILGVMCFLLDITERKENEKLRREFTANVSHELKTPLTTISGYAELIENGVVKPEDIQHFGAKIHNEAKRLLSLINDIIKLSRLDEPKEEPIFEEVDLYEVAIECAETLEPYARNQNQVSLVVQGQPSKILANPRMMEELIYNLGDNAIRYNKAGGKVSINVESKNDEVILSVKDTGIGIEKKYQDRIFERFYRVDESRTTEGTGLGLAIVKHIVQMHKGKISVDSTPGIGTEITVTIPK